jgi:TrpR-related protein YerC/YecD
MSYHSRFENEDTDLLFDVILSLKDREDCVRFFEDVCTIGEIQAIAQRFHIAKLLSENLTYQEIEDKTGASTATISRINKCYKYGADGYKNAIAALSEKPQNL